MMEVNAGRLYYLTPKSLDSFAVLLSFWHDSTKIVRLILNRRLTMYMGLTKDDIFTVSSLNYTFIIRVDANMRFYLNSLFKIPSSFFLSNSNKSAEN